MDTNTLTLLEYDQALQWLSEETHSQAGRLAALSLTPDLPPDEILQSWSLISEAREILIQTDGPDISEHLDLQEIMEPLKVEGSVLNVEQLQAVGFEARTAQVARSFFTAYLEIAPGLADLASGLSSQPELIDTLERSIGFDGEILDTASMELARLRLEQASTRQGLTTKLTHLMRSDSFRQIIQDEIITTRSDRFVIPVRAGGTGKTKGLVHDWSKTGATAFMEPLEVVEDNNQLSLLKRKEKAEIERILCRLSEDCRQAAPELLASGQILTRLDLILAQARLAQRWSATVPQYQPGGGVHLLQAGHPLLMRRLEANGERMTPLDLQVEPEKPVVIISGLNTGGKTVALKTLGLNLLLAQAGLQPAVGYGSHLDFLEVLAVMGDEQDLSSDLSTFSGHIRSLGRVLDRAGPGVLVLLDEIGSGTDPAEGSALGLAVLENLYGTGVLVMAATHYQLIKTWASLTPGVMSVAVNSSDSGQPLYGLSYGSPGFSGGLKMARRLGLPPELVDRAESYLDDGQRRSMELLAKLDEERLLLIRTRQGLEEEKQSLARAEADLRETSRRQVEEWSKKVKTQDQAITEVLSRNTKEFENLKKAMSNLYKNATGREKIQFSETKSQLDKALRSARPQQLSNETPLTNIKEGDTVRVGRLNRSATVRSINFDRGEAWVEAGGLNVKVALSDLFPDDQGVSVPKKGRTIKVTVTPAESFNFSINLLGKTVEEAIDEVEKELDRATLADRKTVHIIHGYGTGRLRQGLRHYLSQHRRVQNFERAPQNAGGDGVTVVTLE